MASKCWISALAERWCHEAHALERRAEAPGGELTSIERRHLAMHARVMRGKAQELRLEHAKVVNRGG